MRYEHITQRDIKRYLQTRISLYPDLTATQIAEDAAHYFYHDEWLDDETNWIWDLAAEAKEKQEKS